MLQAQSAAEQDYLKQIYLLPQEPGVDGLLSSAPPVGARARVVRVQSGDPALSQYLGTLALVPRAKVMVEAVASYGDVISMRVGGTGQAVGSAITRAVTWAVFVEPCDPAASDAMREVAR
jgi:Fe2+ transport system protein FeoA